MCHPKTFYPDNSIYFLTGSTFLHYPYFKEDICKQLLLDQFSKINKKLNIPISAYSISINHYHLMFYLKKGLDLIKIKKLIHGGTSFQYKKNYSTKYKEFWGSSRIYLVTSQESYWKIMGYIIGNLLKHKEVSKFDELKNNLFSSYSYISNKFGDEFAQNLVYEVIDTDESNSGEVNFKQLKQTKVSTPSASFFVAKTR